MKRKISINSVNYAFNAFLRQFRRSLDHCSIGEMLNSKQLLRVLCFMGFSDQEPSEQEIELSKTLTYMLSEPHCRNSVRRGNLFKFLILLCGIEDSLNHKNKSCFEEQITGLAVQEEYEEPLIVIHIGYFENGRWICSDEEMRKVREIFGSMKAKRLSQQEIESFKKSSKSKQKNIKSENSFKPKICLKSKKIIETKNQFLSIKPEEKSKYFRVENRLLQSRDRYQDKIRDKLNRSLENQMKECTFAPKINKNYNKHSSSFHSLQKSKKFSESHLNLLIAKGDSYKNKKQKLQSLEIQLNESAELQKCTFHPQTTKYSSCKDKWVPVRNREKEIKRIRLGQQQREFSRTVKERGYPVDVSWSDYLSHSKSNLWMNKENMLAESNKNEEKNFSRKREPILCIDLKIMNVQQSLNVLEGENISEIAEKISRSNNIHESMWWRVEDLVHKAVRECSDVQLVGNCLFSA